MPSATALEARQTQLPPVLQEPVEGPCPGEGDRHHCPWAECQGILALLGKHPDCQESQERIDTLHLKR